MTVQAGLCLTWSETQMVGFLMQRLNLYCSIDVIACFSLIKIVTKIQQFSSINNLSLCLRKPTIWVPTRSDTNQPVQSQTQARSLIFWITVEEGLCYPCSENKGADQLRGYREADLRLCFRLCRLLVFP